MAEDVLIAMIDGEETLVSGDQAISLYNKGYYGRPTVDGVKLTGFETLHLFELNRVRVTLNTHQLTEEEIVAHFSAITDNFSLRYLVYKDLRNRGYIVNTGRGSSFFFRLYDRGAVPKKDGATYYVTPLQEGGSINLSELEDLEQTAKNSQKILVFGMVDALGDVSYLQATKMEPQDQSSLHQFSDLKQWSWEAAWQDYQKWKK
jgi:tRNA-intron endonuclease